MDRPSSCFNDENFAVISGSSIQLCRQRLKVTFFSINVKLNLLLFRFETKPFWNIKNTITVLLCYGVLYSQALNCDYEK